MSSFLYDSITNKDNKRNIYNDELNNYQIAFDNYAQSHKMSDGESNALRHLGMSLYLSNNYSPEIAHGLGTGYEYTPQFTSLSQPGDTKIDLYNNHIGRVESQKYKDKKLSYEDAINIGADIVKNTNKAALSPNDKRAINMEYPMTFFEKLIGSIKN